MDFMCQINGLDKNNLTLVCADHPGLGRSRPPEKEFKGHYKSDAEVLHKLMLKLGQKKYSVLGYSEGGRHACWMASLFPENVEKLILVSTSATIESKEKRLFGLFLDIRTWDKDKRKIFEEIYGDQLQTIYNKWLYELSNLKAFIPNPILTTIKCPTLIMHGKRDSVLTPNHSFHLKMKIKNSKAFFFDTNHTLLQEQHRRANQMIQQFLHEN